MNDDAIAVGWQPLKGLRLLEQHTRHVLDEFGFAAPEIDALREGQCVQQLAGPAGAVAAG